MWPCDHVTWYSERFGDLDKLNFVRLHNGGMVLGSNQFLLLPKLPLKDDAHFKSGQKRLKNNHLDLLVYIQETLYENDWKGFFFSA